MKFEEALKAMKEGKIVTNRQFDFKIIPAIFFRTSNSENEWTTIDHFNQEEILNENWEIIEGKE